MKGIPCVLMPLFTLLIASCASIQTYEGDALPKEQVAVIKSSYWDHLTVTVVVQEVDGKSVGFSPGDIRILPGKHTIKLRVSSGAGLAIYFASNLLVLEAEAGHTYKVDGIIVGGEHLWAWIIDEDTNEIVAGRKPVSGDPIVMPHYSIEAPPDQGWSLNVIDKAYSTVELKKSHGSVLSYMRFSVNWYVGKNMKLLTAKQVADDYRNTELSDMQAKGVMAGTLKLEDVVMGEEIVGDKKFYTMNYVGIASNNRQISSIYLYFPKETNVDVFFVANYVDAFSGKEVLSKSCKPEFMRVLESLQVKQIKKWSPNYGLPY